MAYWVTTTGLTVLVGVTTGDDRTLLAYWVTTTGLTVG